MNQVVIYSCLMIFSVLVSSISQVMLKKSARKTYDSKLQEYVNPFVIAAYILFFGCTLVTMWALKVIPLSMAPIESLGYIFIPVLGFIFLQEKFNIRQMVGMGFIVIGIAIFSL